MSLRKLLRLALTVIVLTLVGVRVSRQWRYESGWWLAGALTLSALLLVLVIFLVAGTFRKPRAPRDDVPKHPLGLE